jgi:tetratricopeptide (TPR) repeat protein
MVDDLTRRIKAKFEIPLAASAELDRDLKDVTTSSVEAYRHYAEGVNLYERSRYEESIPLFEKAVALDLQTYQGRLDEALAAYKKAESLAPGYLDPLWGQWWVSVLREDWQQADRLASRLAASQAAQLRWAGAAFQGMVRLYQGRSRETLALHPQVAGADPDAERRARASVLAAQVLLEKGSAALAVEQAPRAQNEKGHALEREGLSLEARAQARLGRWREAESAAEKIKATLQSIPGG